MDAFFNSSTTSVASSTSADGEAFLVTSSLSTSSSLPHHQRSMNPHDPPSARPSYLSCPIHRWFSEPGPHTCRSQTHQSLRRPPRGRNSESSPPQSRFHPCKPAR